MALTREDVLHVAELARLSLRPEEIATLTRQLNDILAYVEQLQQLDTQGVSPLAHVVSIANAFREDEVRDGLSRDLALENAPAREEGSFLVPRVI
jgi:aspartyl-tRNA(Asn)/glutamyl-tRNA(Gln) amidotransferase subunit C